MKKLLLAGAATLLAAGAQGGDVVLGTAGGLTGPIAELIAPVQKGRELAVRHVNDQGGILTGDTLVLAVGDSGCDPKAAVDAGTKLVNVDQVVAIVGASCSGATLAMVQSVTVPAGVTVLSDSATAPAITALEDNDLVFRVAPSDAYQGVAIARYVLDQGVTSVAVTYSNDDYNAGLGEQFINAYKSMGGTIAAEQVHEPNKASYRAEVATLGGADAQALVLFAYYGSSGITILRNSLETGAYTKFFGADGMVHETIIEQLGAESLADAAFFNPGADDSTGGWKAYMEVSSVLEAPVSAYVPNGYDATFLMALAIEAAGSADRSKISAALRKVATAPGEIILPGEWAKAKALLAEGKDINYEGATGSLEFDAAGDVPGIYSLYTVNADGKFDVTLVK